MGKSKKKYYIGLDIGTESVGFAAADENYELLRLKGKDVWGVRLFDEAQTAQGRRSFRISRRRLARRNIRLSLLREFFQEEIGKVDPDFFARLGESGLVDEDRKTPGTCSLFNDPDFKDKDFHKKYPTLYHLRCELLKGQKPKDVRFLYLALHHLVKNRGHFLYDDMEDGTDGTAGLAEAWETFAQETAETLELPGSLPAFDKVKDSLIPATGRKRSERREDLLAIAFENEEDRKGKKEKAWISLMLGYSADLKDLFGEEALAKKKLSLADGDLDAKLEGIPELSAGQSDYLMSAARFYGQLRTAAIMGENAYISEYKVAQYERHKAELKELKDFLRAQGDRAQYRTFFYPSTEENKELLNYAAYIGCEIEGQSVVATKEEFYKFLKEKLPGKGTPEHTAIMDKIENGDYLPKLRTSDNGVIPNAFHLKEAQKILENAAGYFPFLLEKDADGLTVSDKILSLVSFRIPYYVGPLNRKSKNAWISRTDEKIYPWNFDRVVDGGESAKSFITRMTSDCPYITGEKVLPRQSLLYCEFTVLNEINNLKVNGHPIPHEKKEAIYKDLFRDKGGAVTKKKIKEYLLSHHGLHAEDEISGVDDRLTSSLSSYHKLKHIIPKIGGEEAAEELIRQMTLFGESRELLGDWLRKNHPELPEEDRKYLLHKVKMKDWGKFSGAFLKLTGMDKETGEVLSVIERMRTEEVNLSAILSDRYTYAEKIEAQKKESLAGKNLRTAVEGLYVSPKIRRGILQSLRIVREIVHLRGYAPEKIMIEIPRDREGDNKKGNAGRTESRKDKLLALYKNCGKQASALFERLEKETEDRLRKDRLYLYYTQFGKCMYSGETIGIENLNTKEYCDIDHIFPRSLIKDDSLDNRVLVMAKLNREKTNDYPIKADIRQKQHTMWRDLLQRGMISQKKYDRLTRQSELTDEELTAFINRQIVETRQSSKAVAELLQELLPDTRIVYSKAGNVSEFRQFYKFIKCRDVNDLHHAKDAYLNIVVGNVYDTKFTQNFLRNIREERGKYSLKPEALYGHAVAGAWVTEDTGSISTVRRVMGKQSVLYTEVPREVRGGLFDQQLMPKGKGQIPRKKGLSVEKYGAYNKPAGAYFALVEHTEKKKRVRTLEAVLLCEKAAYEANGVDFLKEKGFREPKIIVPKILTKSLLEVNGARAYITGRTGDRLILMPANQLYLDETRTQYLKDVLKYAGWCKAAKSEKVPVGELPIDREKNVQLYDFFCEKLESRVYSKWYGAVLNTLKSCRKKFTEISLAKQCFILKEILKTFKCDVQHPNLKEIEGPGTAGVTLLSKKITSVQTAFLIHTSVTGLIEKKVDLLS